MPALQLESFSKQFRGQWLFRNLNLWLQPGEGLAITGPNGSGKSTLLHCLAGLISPDSGQMRWTAPPQGRPSVASPTMEIPGDFTLHEILDFHFTINVLNRGFNPLEELEASGLRVTPTIPIRYFSSGMLQKLRLVLAMLSDSSILLLDEPHSHLDQQGQQWFQNLLPRVSTHRCLAIASNDPTEYRFCKNTLLLEGQTVNSA